MGAPVTKHLTSSSSQTYPEDFGFRQHPADTSSSSLLDLQKPMKIPQESIQFPLETRGGKDAKRTTSIHEFLQMKASLPLHRACQKGKLGVVKKIISEGKTDINSRDMALKGQTPVMAAAYHGQKAVCAYLIKQGCDLSAVDGIGNNLLHYASYSGDLNTVKTLIEKTFDMKIMNAFNQTPIIYAAAGGQVDVFTYLTSMGCDVTGVDVKNNTILHAACEGDNLDMAKHILSLNVVDKESRGWYGRTPLLYAASRGHLKLVHFLVRQGCDVRVVGEAGANILHIACIRGHMEMVKYILSLNVVDMESRGRYGRTPLMYAAEFGHVKLFHFLVSKLCDVDTLDEYGANILHIACIGGYVKLVKHIMSLNVVDMESRGRYGRTPLMYAAVFGNIELFHFLVSKGCDVRALDEYGANILHIACIGGHVEMTKHIMSLNVVDKESRGRYGRTPLMYAAWHGHLELFNFLVSQGCVVNTLDKHGDNILHIACIVGHVEMAKQIMSFNVIDMESRGRYRRTPLLTAVQNGHVELFKFLFTTGCRITVRGKMDWSVLHFACGGGAVNMVKHLISIPAIHAMIHLKTWNGQTAAHVAQERGYNDIVCVLKEY